MGTREIIESCEHLYDDLELASVKTWKESTGGKAIGYMPVYVPREIVHACRMLPVGIMGGGLNLEIIKGDAYFQSYICHIPRSTIELGVTGRLDSLDGMLFPAICDVIRNLSGMWQILFKDKYTKYLDLPQNLDPAIGGEFYRYEIETLMQDLAELGGFKPGDADLRRSIRLYNENRRAIEELYAFRAATPHLAPTFHVYLMMRAGNLMDVEAHTRMIREYMEHARRENRKKQDNIRVVVTGAFCEQPPVGIVKALEDSGCYIVDDDWVLGARYLLEDIPEDGDPLAAITNAYLGQTVETASRYEPVRRKGDFLVNRVRALRADGVIFAAPSFCDPALLERPMLTDALMRAGIPHTSFNYAENTGQFRVFGEQTGTFADSIKLWGGQ